MPAVDEYRESLLRLQGVWDSLSMLGQMSGTLPDIAATRSAFQSLTETLLDSLGRCLLGNVVQHMRNQGQVAIDILVRNLFERTADIGFLSTDTDRARVHAGRRRRDPTPRSSASWSCASPTTPPSTASTTTSSCSRPTAVCWPGWTSASGAASLPRSPGSAQALAGAPYVEHYGPSPTMGGRDGAALRRRHPQRRARPLGVMCLSFRLADEMRGVFQQLLSADDPAVIALVDAARRGAGLVRPLAAAAGRRAAARRRRSAATSTCASPAANT